MANNYQESSSFLSVSKEKLLEAQNIINRVVEEIENEEEEGYCGCCPTIREFTEEQSGVWFYGEEFIDTGHVERIARALIEELELDEPFFCSWAYTCSKPRIDEFGGGAFVIKRGYKTYWCDAVLHVEQQLEAGKLEPLDYTENK